MKVIDNHLKLKTPTALADYLEERGVEIDDIDGATIRGYFMGSEFFIDYQYGFFMGIYVPSDAKDVMKRLKQLAWPAMWHKDKSCKDDGFYAPIVEYETDASYAVEWSYKSPVKFLTDFMLDVKRSQGNIKVNILYPGYSTEYFDEVLKYGTYEGYFNDWTAYRLDKFSEIEIYDLMAGYLEKRESLERDNGNTFEEYSVKVDSVNYCLARLAQETKRFGVSVPAPTEQFEFDSPELLAWLTWWEMSYKDILKKYPKLEKILFTDKKLDIRPEGDFKQYLPAVIEKMQKFDEYCAKMQEQLQEDASSLVEELEGEYKRPNLRLVTDDEDDDKK